MGTEYTTSTTAGSTPVSCRSTVSGLINSVVRLFGPRGFPGKSPGAKTVADYLTSGEDHCYDDLSLSKFSFPFLLPFPPSSRHLCAQIYPVVPVTFTNLTFLTTTRPGAAICAWSPLLSLAHLAVTWARHDTYFCLCPILSAFTWSVGISPALSQCVRHTTVASLEIVRTHVRALEPLLPPSFHIIPLDVKFRTISEL
ncbi:hypothetical protein An09g04260 [Aspergillus niger]|uniref:Uncharacterized protein n=2 Tax=Aspergillus niger TaxID=5061 RepID=A2QU39_ASPNC|nr:hypothetical protein An09g04260 [Aspergillus niger]CAK96867.1 hypothetical protein An09g04260 [Aspergillus niger]